MSEHVIKLPDVGEGITEAEIVEWHVKVGDTVAEDDLVGAVMTDKAAVDIPSPVAGTVSRLGGEIGDILAVGSDYVCIRLSGEQPQSSDQASPKTAQQQAPETAPVQAVSATTSNVSQPDPSAPTVNPVDPPAIKQEGAEIKRVLASPAVRRRAFEHGVALHYVQGSGPAGRITHDDLEGFLAGHSGAQAAGHGARPEQPRDMVEEIKVVGMRRQIAQKMQEAKRRIPHFSYVEETDVTALDELRAQLNSNRKPEQPKLNILPFVALALIRALEEFPQMNARFDDDAQIIRRHSGVHLGIAAQTDRGLMVPVMHHAQALDVWAIANKIAELAEAARGGRIRRDDLTGATITLTSLGALGGIVTTPVINYPEVAIVGINRIVTRPVFVEERVEKRLLMNLSSSFDHRVVDGFDAAEFIQRIRAYIEYPSTIFIPG